MNTNNVRRLESAWLLREFAWGIKRYADRIERCCTENPNDENERKAQLWLERAKERLAKFRASRREYLTEWKSGTPADFIDDLLRTAFKALPPRNPWRAGKAPAEGRKLMFIRPGLFLLGDGFTSPECKAWRPA